MPRKRVPDKHLPAAHGFLKACLLGFFLVSGATSLSLEVAWSKELSYLLGVDIYSATTVVTAFMAGLGLGAILIARWGRWRPPTLRLYGLLQLTIGVCGVVSIPLFRATLPLFSIIYDRLNFNPGLFLLARFLVVFGLMMVPVTLMGMTLPAVVGASFGRVRGRYAYLAGLLYGVNTVGAVIGTLVAGFFSDTGHRHPENLPGHRVGRSARRLRGVGFGPFHAGIDQGRGSAPPFPRQGPAAPGGRHPDDRSDLLACTDFPSVGHNRLGL